MSSSLLTGYGCGIDLDALVKSDCTVAPADLRRARQLLRSEGDEPCRDGDCPDAYVLGEIARASPTCEAVTVAGEAATTEQTGTPLPTAPPDLHVLFESSKSMEAYLKGRSSLKDDIDDALSRLTLTSGPVADTVSLSYVGQRERAYSGDLMNFSQTLVPGRLPSGVGTTASDVASLVGKAFAKTSPNTVAVLISDFVFSPGRRYDPPTYLRRQRIRIRELADSTRAQRGDFQVVLVAAEADFDGVYYDYNNATTGYRGRRPYYYLVAGPHRAVSDVTQVLTATTGGTSVAFAGATVELPYRVEPAEPTGRRGRYEVTVDEATGRATLEDARVGSTGAYGNRLAVPVLVDLSALPTADVAPQQIHVATPSTLSVATVERERGTAPYTHRLLLVNDGRAYPGTWTVEFPRGGADAFASSYLDDDRGDPAAFDGRTFGLQSLVEGLADAFEKEDGTPLARLQIDVAPN